MSWTHCSLVDIDQNQYNFQEHFYFHENDRQIVMENPLAEVSVIVRIKGNFTQKEGFGLVGGKLDGAGEITEILTGPEDKIALGCRPWNDTDSVFVSNP